MPSLWTRANRRELSRELDRLVRIDFSRHDRNVRGFRPPGLVPLPQTSCGIPRILGVAFGRCPEQSKS
jgi:hypothetical protein